MSVLGVVSGAALLASGVALLKAATILSRQKERQSSVMRRMDAWQRETSQRLSLLEGTVQALDGRLPCDRLGLRRRPEIAVAARLRERGIAQAIFLRFKVEEIEPSLVFGLRSHTRRLDESYDNLFTVAPDTIMILLPRNSHGEAMLHADRVVTTCTPRALVVAEIQSPHPAAHAIECAVVALAQGDGRTFLSII